MLKKLTLLLLITLTASCHRMSLKEGFAKWHEEGRLYVIVEGPIQELVRDEAQDAIGRWVRCGYIQKLPKEVLISEADFSAPEVDVPKGMVLCGMGELNGNVIQLNNNVKRFVWDKSCVNYEHTIGHELGHLMGFRHEDLEEYKQFNIRMYDCGFPMSGRPVR